MLFLLFFRKVPKTSFFSSQMLWAACSHRPEPVTALIWALISPTTRVWCDFGPDMKTKWLIAPSSPLALLGHRANTSATTNQRANTGISQTNDDMQARETNWWAREIPVPDHECTTPIPTRTATGSLVRATNPATVSTKMHINLCFYNMESPAWSMHRHGWGTDIKRSGPLGPACLPRGTAGAGRWTACCTRGGAAPSHRSPRRSATASPPLRPSPGRRTPICCTALGQGSSPGWWSWMCRGRRCSPADQWEKGHTGTALGSRSHPPPSDHRSWGWHAPPWCKSRHLRQWWSGIQSPYKPAVYAMTWINVIWRSPNVAITGYNAEKIAWVYLICTVQGNLSSRAGTVAQIRFEWVAEQRHQWPWLIVVEWSWYRRRRREVLIRHVGDHLVHQIH